MKSLDLTCEHFPHQFTFSFINEGWPNIQELGFINLQIALFELGPNQAIKVVTDYISLKLHSLATPAPEDAAMPPVIGRCPSARSSCMPGAEEITPDLVGGAFGIPANEYKFVLDAHRTPFSLSTI